MYIIVEVLFLQFCSHGAGTSKEPHFYICYRLFSNKKDQLKLWQVSIVFFFIRVRVRFCEKKMVNPIPESVRKLWDEWNIRGVILLSLCLQIILTLIAPCRKRSRNKLIIMVLWSVYLLADVTAVFALGLISNAKGDNNLPSSALLAFWPPFLILHLGGPDNITAFAPEDNELWLRHIVGFLVQAVGAVYIFLLSLPQTKLFIPFTLVFTAATIKYIERTRAFYLGSFDGFQSSVSSKSYFQYLVNKRNMDSPNTVRVQAHVARAALAFIRAAINTSEVERRWPENTSDVVIAILMAYKHWRYFKGVIVNLIFRFKEYREMRSFITKRSPEEAYRIIEAELNFIYEALYTKVQVLHSLVGPISRLLSLVLLISAFSIFHFKIDKHSFDGLDLAITYTLFWCAIVLNIAGLFIFLSFDLTLAALVDWNIKTFPSSGPPQEWNHKSNFLYWMVNRMLHLKQSEWHGSDTEALLATPLILGRWSGKVPAFNLLSYSLRRRPTGVYKTGNRYSKIIQKLSTVFPKVTPGAHLQFIRSASHLVISFLGLDGVRYVSQEPLSKEVWDFIFNELRGKSQLATNPEAAMRISSARGESILKDKDHCRSLLRFVFSLTYDQSILVWHIATELLYQSNQEDTSSDCKISKVLSDYLLYILIQQPSILSSVRGIANVRFQDTCTVATQFVKSNKLNEKLESEICTEILALDPYKSKADTEILESISVLYDGCILARELSRLDDLHGKEEKWKIISKVWVEMLSYAAIISETRFHAQQVNTGGELISFVWLLMIHFGLQLQFQTMTEENHEQ